MKRLFLIILLSLIISTNLYADEIFDEMCSAIRQWITVRERYKGKVISGEGYVDYVITFTPETTYVLLVEDPDEYCCPKVRIEISKDSPYLTTAETLNKGQKISFSGEFESIIDMKILIKGQKISPQ